MPSMNRDRIVFCTLFVRVHFAAACQQSRLAIVRNLICFLHVLPCGIKQLVTIYKYIHYYIPHRWGKTKLPLLPYACLYDTHICSMCI